MPNQRTLVVWYNDVPDIPGLPVNTDMYWLRTTGGTCDEDWQAFLSLSAADRIAQSSPNIPTTLTAWMDRGCNGGVVYTDQWGLNGPFVPDEGSTGNPTPTNPTPGTNPGAGAQYVGGSSDPIIYTL